MLEMQQVTSEDDPFLYEVYADTRLEEMSAIGFEGEQREMFLRMQFDMQKRSYAMQYPAAEHQIMLLDGVRIGRLITQVAEESVLLIDLSLLATYRNRGIGTRLLLDLQQRASAMGKSVRLHVLQNNSARHLYERLGFRITGDKSPYYAMEWKAV